MNKDIKLSFEKTSMEEDVATYGIEDEVVATYIKEDEV